MSLKSSLKNNLNNSSDPHARGLASTVSKIYANVKYVIKQEDFSYQKLFPHRDFENPSDPSASQYEMLFNNKNDFYLISDVDCDPDEDNEVFVRICSKDCEVSDNQLTSAIFRMIYININYLEEMKEI